MVDKDKFLDEILGGKGLFGRYGDITHDIASAGIEVNGLEGLGPFGELAGLDSTLGVLGAVNVVVKDSALGGELCCGLPL
jgi:hypothetical protein